MLQMIKLRLVAALRRVSTLYRLSRSSAPVRKFGIDLHVGSNSRMWAPERLEIGDHSYLGHDVYIETNCCIGKYVLIANRVGLVGRHDHDFRTIGVPVRFGRWIGSVRSPSKYRTEAVDVGDDVWIGYGATILSGVQIGRGAVVAAGSVVKDNVASYTIVGGNPATSIGRRFGTEQDIERHESMVQSGRFRSSERGFDYWLVEPGQP